MKNHKKTIIKLLIGIIAISILAIIGLLLFKYLTQKEEIVLTTKEISVVKNSFINEFSLDEKIEKLSGKIITKKKVKNIDVKISSGNLEIANNNYKSTKNWDIDKIGLVVGNNNIEVIATLESGKEISETFYINNTNKSNSDVLDNRDNDNDGLANYLEDVFGTDKNKADTDEDGLNDYEEIFLTFTDPNKADTDENGILDGNEDFDEDEISNKDEMQHNTNPFLKDTDGDGISDYEEIFLYHTDPNKADTDEDGVSDYEEIFLYHTDPLVVQKSFDINYSPSNELVGVSIKGLSGEQLNSLSIVPSSNIYLNDKIIGRLGKAYDFNINGKFDNAEISFEIDNSKLKDDSVPTIYYFNEKNQLLEEIETRIENGKAYANVKHFSTYVLIDKTEHDAIWSDDLHLKTNPESSNLDVVFVIDISKSMDENDPTDSRKKIMSNFISSLKKNDRAGVVLFRRNASILNSGFASSKSDKKILITDVFNISNDDSYNMNSGTNGSAGLHMAIGMFSEKNKATKYIIFLTDGDDTTVSYPYNTIYNMARQKNITILSIGLGNEVNPDNLREIADETGGKYFFAEDSSSLFENYSGILDETVDYRKDSNNDGISDYFTQLICDGTLKTSTGINPFADISGDCFEELQKNKDFDGDGLLNGDEVEVIVHESKVYIKLHSYPTKIDSDGDGVGDKDDNSPLEKFNSKFSKVDNINHVPATPIDDKFEEESTVVYNTETGDYGSSKGRAEFQATVFGSMPAAKTLRHFLGNTGTIYDFNNDWGFLKTYRGREHLAKNTNSLIEVVESTVKNNSKLTFASNVEFTGSDFSKSLDDLADIGWWYAVGSTRATLVGEASRSGENYKMTLYYRIVDFYDWRKDAGLISGFGGLVNDSEMYRLHTYGVAQQFRVTMTYKMDIIWTKGDRYYLSKIWLWETPKTMQVNQSN